MKIIYSGKNIQVTDDLRDLTENRLEKLEKYFDEEVRAEVTFSEFRENQLVEITISLPGTFIRAEESSTDFRTSLDRATDRLARQIRKHKTKLKNRYQGKNTIRYDNIPDFDVDAFNEELNNSEDILREKFFSVIPMSEEEAKLQIDLLGHDFFVFNNSSTDEINVLYKRHHGGYGLLRPE